MLTFQDIENMIQFLTAKIENNFHFIIFKIYVSKINFQFKSAKGYFKNI